MEDEPTNTNYIITGMSGTGKTTLLHGLRDLGFDCFEEPARKVLEYQSRTDGPALPSKDPRAFVKEMLDQNISDAQTASALEKVAFFDRGIPDTVAYALRFNVDSSEFEKASMQTRYNQSVFLMPPWKEIFTTGKFRKASFEQYLEFHELIKKVYVLLEYNLVDVPLASTQDRLEFVLSKVDNKQS